MPIDDFEDRVASLTSPPSHAFSVTPDDAADLSRATRAVMVTTAGDVAVVTIAGDSAVPPALQPGVQYAIRARRVAATGTTATGILGLA